MKKNTLLLAIVWFAFCGVCTLNAKAQLPDKKELTNKMLAAINNIQTIKYRFWKQERMRGKMEIGEQEVKLNVKPFKAYLYNYAPNSGAEVLFIPTQMEGKALVKPGSFPWTNLNLDPMGDILRKGQHHTLYELGFEYTGGLLADTYKKFGNKIEEYCTIEGSVKYANRDCWKVILENKDYKFLNYQVKQGEDLIKIAKKQWLSEYLLLEYNKLKSYTDVKVGQNIKIPNSYAKKVVLYIDKQNFLPIYQQLYDNEGVFAEYKYTNLLLNLKIDEKEFTKDYKDYKF